MTLKGYLIKIRTQPNEFVVNFNNQMQKENSSVRISIASLYRYFNGKPARLKTARALEKFTNFEVTVEELLGINDGKK